jgi:pimeloyl-ACP methyl ester carboxylesterase
MATMQTSRGVVSYTDDGSGPPILLLHAALHDRTDYGPVHGVLAKGRRVLALDWPGHGESPLPAAPLGAVQFGDLLVEFADRLDLSNVVVVGNSVGGYAASRLALERPERVAGLVLVNTGGFTPHSVFTRLFCAVMGNPAVVKAVLPLSVRAYMRVKSASDRAVVARVTARAKTDEGARTAAALWRSFTEPDHDLRTRAAQISAPVLTHRGASNLPASKR